MQPDAPVPSDHTAERPGLPPVKPPSGRFILQLFLIPGLIVAGLVLVFVFGGLAWFGPSSPESFLSRLDSSNPDIRWRAAHELAQVLKRPESVELASDPKFALDVAERLQAALTELDAAENAAGADLKRTFDQIQAEKPTPEDKEQREHNASLAAWNKLRPQRDLVLFLTSCMGDFVVPVGGPVLREMVLQDKGQLKTVTLKRRRAVWALANLGDNLQRRYFGKNAKPEDKVLTSEQKADILAKLGKEAGNPGKRGYWARWTLGVLEKQHPHAVDIALEICVRGNDTVKKADDPYLRELVAFALNFWDGDRVEPTLVQLSIDDGHGQRIEIGDAE